MAHLFSEFKPTTATDWKNQVVKDLKGEPYENLIWQNENGFNIEPFYTAEDIKTNYSPAFTHSDWEICVSNSNNSDSEINKQFLKQLNAGATSIFLEINNHNLEIVLKDIQLQFIRSTFRVNSTNSEKLNNYLNTHYRNEKLNCSIFFEAFKTSNDLLNWYKTYLLFEPNKSLLTVSFDALEIHNQQCFAYYEIAIALSALVEQVNLLSQNNKKSSSNPVIKLGVNSDYFIQMAKLRAVRRLWALIKNEYAINNDLHILVETSLTNKTISDSYNNLLRTSVEAMAAIAGGCNELIVTEFDTFFTTNKNLSQRMAVNQQLILKEESYFDKVADVACGSYYIETLTDLIAEKSLKAFKNFEKEGGYFECVSKNIFSNAIKMQQQSKTEAFENQKQIIVGINKFKNEKEKISISNELKTKLKNLNIHNPALRFEINNFL